MESYNPAGNSLIEAIKKRMRNLHKSKRELALDLHINPTAMTPMFRRNSMQVSKLWNICTVLKHNFFYDLAHKFDSNNPQTNETVINQMQTQINELTKEVERLKIENEVLLKVLGK